MIRGKFEGIFSSKESRLQSAFLEFNRHFSEIEDQPKSLEKNVKLLLASRFLNHVYATLLLVEAGLYSDALTCERSAIESLAAYRLICADPKMAEKYNTGNFPKPVEVRKQLEKLGYTKEVKNIQNLYSSASGITHISRENERLSVRWQNQNGEMRVGGYFDINELNHMLEFISALLFWFLTPLGENG